MKMQKEIIQYYIGKRSFHVVSGYLRDLIDM